MNRWLDPSTRELASYPTSEVLKHAPSLSEACIFEIGPGYLKNAVLLYAEQHFKNVNTFDADTQCGHGSGEDMIGEYFRRHRRRMTQVQQKASQKQESRKAPEVALTVGTGTHSSEFEGKPLWICYYLRDNAVSGPSYPLIFQKLILFTYVEGMNMMEMKGILQRFANMCLEWHYNIKFAIPKEKKFRLFRFRVDYRRPRWRDEGQKRARSAESVILKKNLQDEIFKDVEDFLSEETKNWYVEHGVPRRRSYLLYGEPGSGKTSMIKVLAGKFKLNACFLSLASGRADSTGVIDNQILNDAICTLPAEALLVLEDVDTLFNEDRVSKDGVNITYSTLLQALDGIPSGEGRITIMTTNHLSKLDSAMIRCGRVDRMFHIGAPDKEQIENYFQTYYPNCSQGIKSKFSSYVLKRHGEQRSMATLQQFFLLTRKDPPETAVNRLDEFYEKFFNARLPGGPHYLQN